MKRILQKVKPDKRIIIGYSASFLLLLITYIITLFANNSLKNRTALVEHTYKVNYEMESLLSKVKDAETGARGYALTRDTDFLAPYNNSAQIVDSIHHNLVFLSGENQLQQQRLAELKGLVHKRFELLEAGINYIKNGTADTGYKLRSKQLEAKWSMDKIRRSIAFMQNEENKLLAERDKNLKATFSSINTITITSLLLTLLLVVIGFVTYTSENKARKLAMHNIREYQQQLSRRIDELNTANAQLLQMRSMEKFAVTGRIARTIAHEVRNPLTNINLATSQLKTDIDTADENIINLFDIIDRNSNRINRLISDLLQSTKFSELNFQNIPVNDLLEETLIMAKDRIGLNQVRIEKNYGTPCSINVDIEKIKIALLNIIINAIESMNANEGILKISTKTEAGNCLITITDNGTGMDDVALSKLFEPYFTNKPGGNGLGLANTQNIIFNHKGTIAVASTPGKGSTFTVTLAVA